MCQILTVGRKSRDLIGTLVLERIIKARKSFDELGNKKPYFKFCTEMSETVRSDFVFSKNFTLLS